MVEERVLAHLHRVYYFIFKTFDVPHFRLVQHSQVLLPRMSQELGRGKAAGHLMT